MQRLMLRLTGGFRKRLKYMLAGVPLALVLLSSCIPWVTAERGDSMALKGTIPPIDAAAPAQTETATFSLG
jgi:hypothetical protein